MFILMRGERMKNRIMQIRHEQNLSMTELARLSGVSRTHLWRIENEISEPSFKTMTRIAKALKTDLWDVFLSLDF